MISSSHQTNCTKSVQPQHSPLDLKMEECSLASTVGVSRVVCICSLVRGEVTPPSFTVSVMKGQSLGQVYILCVCVCVCMPGEFVWCRVSGQGGCVVQLNE